MPLVELDGHQEATLLASVQSQAPESVKLRDEPLDRYTCLGLAMALQSGDDVRRCFCQRLGAHPSKGWPDLYEQNSFYYC